MTTFSLLDLLGHTIAEEKNNHHLLIRYAVRPEQLETHLDPLRKIIYAQHSSFDLAPLLRDLGYPETAQTLSELRSNVPNEDRIRASNLVEILASEYAREVLGFEAVVRFPKRFNPNPDQAMKGPDVLGERNDAGANVILLGEAKWRAQASRGVFKEAYESLVRVCKEPIAPYLAMARELRRLSCQRTADLDRLQSADSHNLAQRHTLIFIASANDLRSPDKVLEDLYSSDPLPNLTIVHVCLPNLKAMLDALYRVPG
jgi:hypothetical protein